MKPFKSRMLIMSALLFAVLIAIFVRMNTMMIDRTDTYAGRAEYKSTKTLTLTGMRGAIYDANMVPLAYDRRSYNVTFYRDPSLSSEAERANYTQAIIKAIELIESNGKSTITEFWLKKDEKGAWYFDSGSESETVEATRESQWRSNFYLTKTPERDLYKSLCDKYLLGDDMSEELKLKVLAIWQASRMNSYNSTAVVIAYDVGYETVSEIEARSMELNGISAEESSVREYPQGNVACHIVGYTGKITSVEALANYTAKGYPTNATIGASGIEYSMEDQLSPFIQYRQGERVVEIDTRGKIVREISYEAPEDGNSIVLTINTQLQKVMREALQSTINSINKQQRQQMESSTWQRRNLEELAKYSEAGKQVSLAKTGAIVAMDPNTGAILGMVSLPDYSLSIFNGAVDAGAWSEVVNNSNDPLYNRAISTKDTPGSIFKLCTALGGLSEGAITLDERISDKGSFTLTDASKPSKCWTSHIGDHANQTVVEGLKNSCNYFFYTVGYRLGIDKLTKWAAALGLTSRTNVELPNEATSFIGNQGMLYDPELTLEQQYTYKPLISANVIRTTLRNIREARSMDITDEEIEEVIYKLLDIVTEYDEKSQWYAPIREVLLYDMGLPGEYISANYMVNTFVTYLQDLFWTPNETIMAAIGQSITQVTPIAVARYVSAIANGGKVFDAQIIDKIIASDGSIVLDKEPVIANQIDSDPAYFAAIQKGMAEVTSVENDGTAAEQFKNTRYQMAAKTGTSERTEIDIENNAWLVCYAPVQNPKIVVVVYIQNGYAGARSASAAIKTIEYYLDNLVTGEGTAAAKDNTVAQ